MRLLGQEFSRFVAEIDQAGGGFEDRDVLAAGAVAVDDRGHLVVGADLQELGLELVALADVDGMDVPLQPALLEHDMNLVPVGRGPRIAIDHRWILWSNSS